MTLTIDSVLTQLSGLRKTNRIRVLTKEKESGGFGLHLHQILHHMYYHIWFIIALYVVLRNLYLYDKISYFYDTFYILYCAYMN